MWKTTIFIILAAILVSAGFLFMKYQSFARNNADLQSKIETGETEIANLKSEIAASEQELAVWKATDLEKEAKLLQIKLDAAEKDLAVAEKKALKLKTNLGKMAPYKDAIAAVDNFFGKPMTNANLNNIDFKIGALNDSQISAQWKEARADIDVSRNSWGSNTIVHTLFLIVSRIRGLAS